MAASLFAVNKGFLDDVEVKKVPLRSWSAPVPEDQPRALLDRLNEKRASTRKARTKLN
jgi:hypothetical protein